MGHFIEQAAGVAHAATFGVHQQETVSNHQGGFKDTGFKEEEVELPPPANVVGVVGAGLEETGTCMKVQIHIRISSITASYGRGRSLALLQQSE